MKRSHSLPELLKRLGDDAGLPEEDGAREALREQTVARMMAVRDDVRRGRENGATRAVRWIAAVAVVLGLVAVVFVVRSGAPGEGRSVEDGARLRAISGLVEVVHGAGTEIVGADARVIAPGDRVHVRAGAHASVFLPSGATFSASGETSLQVRREPSREEVQLAMGGIDVHVPKLRKGSGFVVRTADASVTVRGTRFTVGVRLLPDAKLVTVVEVSEGVVAVESGGRGIELHPGQRWSSRAEEAPDVADAPATAPSPSAATANAESSPVVEGALAVPNRPRPSTLGSENELLAQAMTAVSESDDARALALLDSFLSKHGRSPLAENAALERLRILSRQGDPAAAARAARRYLARYPRGVGRELAQRLSGDESSAKPAPR